MSPLGVFLLLGIVAYVSLSWLAAANARDGGPGAHFAAWMLPGVAAVACVPWLFLAWVFNGLPCENACEPAWLRDPQAWQHSAQLLGALAGAAAAVLSTILAARRHYAAAASLLTAAATLAVAWVIVVL